jgi:hypothetical protein
MTTANIDVRVNSQELENFIVNLNEADRELRSVAASADAVSSATSNFGSSTLTASNDIGRLNTNVKALVSLQIGETFNSLAGTVEELGRHAGELENYFREVAATTRNPLTRSLAEGAAATANFSSENSALMTSIFKVIAGVASLGAVLVPKFAMITTAVTGFAAAAANTLGPFTQLLYGIAGASGAAAASTAIVVVAITAMVGVIAWGSYKLLEYVASLDDVEVAMRENIEAVRGAQDAATELNRAYVALTPQMQRVAELEEQVNSAREDSSQYMANVIAEQAEVLGLYERQEEIAQRALLLAEARNRWLGTEEAQLMINTMLQGDVEEADIARVMALQSQERFNRLNTAELQEQLRILPALVSETTDLALSAEAHGRVLTRVSELAGAIVGFFQSNPAAEETGVGRTIGGIRREAEAANTALNQLAGSNDAVFARLFADAEGLQLTPELTALYREATEEQRTFLLGLWEQQDDYLESEAERRREAAEQERLELEESQAALQRHLDEQARLTQERMAREEEARAANLEAFKADIEERYELLHGYSLAYEDMTDKQIQNTARMTDSQAKAIGFTRETMAQAGAASAVALAAAAGEGKSAADAMKAVIGQELVSVGTAAIFKGAIKTAGGNPMGLLETAAGVAAVAAGTAMGASKGASPSVPVSTTPGENQTTYTSVSFGFVGDRRAAGREVAEVQENANRRGY